MYVRVYVCESINCEHRKTHSLQLIDTCNLKCPMVSCPGCRTFTHYELTFTRVSLYEVFRVVVISSFGKLSALAAMVWTGDFYLWLPAVLVLPAHFQAYRGEIVCGCS